MTIMPHRGESERNFDITCLGSPGESEPLFGFRSVNIPLAAGDGHWGTMPAFDRTGERRDNAPEGWKAVLLWLRSLPAETTECDGCDGFSIYDVCVF